MCPRDFKGSFNFVAHGLLLVLAQMILRNWKNARAALDNEVGSHLCPCGVFPLPAYRGMEVNERKDGSELILNSYHCKQCLPYTWMEKGGQC